MKIKDYKGLPSTPLWSTSGFLDLAPFPFSFGLYFFGGNQFHGKWFGETNREIFILENFCQLQISVGKQSVRTVVEPKRLNWKSDLLESVKRERKKPAGGG